MKIRKLKRTIGGSAILLALPGCTGWMQKVAQIERHASINFCTEAGYTADHPHFEECVANTTAARTADARQSIVDGLVVGTAINAAKVSSMAPPLPQPGYRGGVSQQSQPPSTVRSSQAPGQAALTRRETMQICPDGSYIYGTTCHLAPNGQYLSGPPTMAPDGRYVSGKPQIAPNGSYVGSGPVRICPDGSYVAGARCILAPNGAYVGGP